MSHLNEGEREKNLQSSNEIHSCEYRLTNTGDWQSKAYHSDRFMLGIEIVGKQHVSFCPLVFNFSLSLCFSGESLIYQVKEIKKMRLPALNFVKIYYE